MVSENRKMNGLVMGIFSKVLFLRKQHFKLLELSRAAVDILSTKFVSSVSFPLQQG